MGVAGTFRVLAIQRRETVVTCFPGSLSSGAAYLGTQPGGPESPQGVHSLVDRLYNREYPEPQTLPQGQPPSLLEMAAKAQPLQLPWPGSLHSKPRRSNPTAQMHPAPPPGSPPTKAVPSAWNALPRSRPPFSHCSLVSRQPEFDLSSATYWLCDLAQVA